GMVAYRPTARTSIATRQPALAVPGTKSRPGDQCVRKPEFCKIVWGVASPLLANIVLHHAVDRWRADNYPHIPFERYADDIVVHWASKAQAPFIQQPIERRLTACKLEAHPDKTKIVYCRDSNRNEEHPPTRFDFLGYTFRPRTAINQRRKEFFVRFAPAVSGKAARHIVATRRPLKLPAKSNTS